VTNYSSRPRVELDPDIIERYQAAATANGMSLTVLINLVLRSVETVRVVPSIDQKKTTSSNPLLRIRSRKWQIRL